MSNVSTALSTRYPSPNAGLDAPPADASPIRWGYPIRALMDPEAEMLSVSQQWVLA